jgi:rhamnosyltransferase
MTAHYPDRHVRDVVASALRQVDRVVVVDNTPVDGTSVGDLIDPHEDVLVIRSGHNAGLAAALNRGVQAAEDAELILFLDQDSALPGDLVERLRAHLDAVPKIGIAGPAPWDPAADRYLDPRTTMRPDVADLAVVITSGMLVRRAVIDEVGPFREDFFVDCVDQEFCLRAREMGWRVIQDKRVLLAHSLGGTRWHGWGFLRFRATHHPTWRLYWVGRNTVILIREHWRKEPVWSFVWFAILVYWGITIALVEPPRIARLRVMAHGVRDGFAGRTDEAKFPGRLA